MTMIESASIVGILGVAQPLAVAVESLKNVSETREIYAEGTWPTQDCM